MTLYHKKQYFPIPLLLSLRNRIVKFLSGLNFQTCHYNFLFFFVIDKNAK